MAAFAMWGNVGNQAYGMPLVSLTPVDPTAQGYVLAWDTVNQALAFMPMSFDSASGDVTNAGNFGLAAGKVYKVNGLQVTGARITGWVASTGTPNRATFDTATVTLAQLAGAVMALKQDLTTHGMIGT